MKHYTQSYCSQRTLLIQMAAYLKHHQENSKSLWNVPNPCITSCKHVLSSRNNVYSLVTIELNYVVSQSKGCYFPVSELGDFLS